METIDFQPKGLESSEHNFIGPDAEILDKLTVPPLTTLEENYIVVDKKHFPPGEITKSMLKGVSYSGRSSLAQCGVDFVFLPNFINEKVVQALNEGQTCHLPVLVRNRSERPVEIEGDVMRFFYLKESTRLRGQNLKHALASGELVIEGTEGADWRIADTFWYVTEDDDLYLGIIPKKRGFSSPVFPVFLSSISVQ